MTRGRSEVICLRLVGNIQFQECRALDYIVTGLLDIITPMRIMKNVVASAGRTKIIGELDLLAFRTARNQNRSFQSFCNQSSGLPKVVA
eukprot:762903-Hanusia_phi.AAC.4